MKALYVDVDDTLFETSERRVEWMKQELGEHCADLYVLESNDQEVSWPADARVKVREFCRRLDQDPDFYMGLPTVVDAVACLQQLNTSGVAWVRGYLSARPANLALLTSAELTAAGFPSAPVHCRPADVPRRDSANWKLSTVLQAIRSTPGMIVIIDDDPAVGREVRDEGVLHEITSIRFAATASSWKMSGGGCSGFDWRGITRLLDQQSQHK